MPEVLRPYRLLCSEQVVEDVSKDSQQQGFIKRVPIHLFEPPIQVSPLGIS